jgi:hypothetical protein
MLVVTVAAKTEACDLQWMLRTLAISRIGCASNNILDTHI